MWWHKGKNAIFGNWGMVPAPVTLADLSSILSTRFWFTDMGIAVKFSRKFWWRQSDNQLNLRMEEKLTILKLSWLADCRHQNYRLRTRIPDPQTLPPCVVVLSTSFQGSKCLCKWVSSTWVSRNKRYRAHKCKKEKESISSARGEFEPPSSTITCNQRSMVDRQRQGPALMQLLRLKFHISTIFVP